MQCLIWQSYPTSQCIISGWSGFTVERWMASLKWQQLQVHHFLPCIAKEILLSPSHCSCGRGYWITLRRCPFVPLYNFKSLGLLLLKIIVFLSRKQENYAFHLSLPDTIKYHLKLHLPCRVLTLTQCTDCANWFGNWNRSKCIDSIWSLLIAEKWIIDWSEVYYWEF